MNETSRDHFPSQGLTPIAGELIADYRERLARRRAEAAERHAVELAEQSSTHNSPSDRIRIWERRHGLALPTSPSHALLKVVARGTGLSLEAVLDEQRLRRRPADAGPPAQAPDAGDAPAPVDAA